MQSQAQSSEQEPECRFCRSKAKSAVIRGKHGFVSGDRYPVNPGHMLVIPYEHYPTYIDAPSEVKQELWELVDQAINLIEQEHQPDGFNVGINIGEYGGQSIMHLHIHVIPRYKGDVENPKGGVRGVIPDKQKYQLIS